MICTRSLANDTFKKQYTYTPILRKDNRNQAILRIIMLQCEAQKIYNKRGVRKVYADKSRVLFARNFFSSHFSRRNFFFEHSARKQL